jgi:hypothetical protein
LEPRPAEFEAAFCQLISNVVSLHQRNEFMEDLKGALNNFKSSKVAPVRPRWATQRENARRIHFAVCSLQKQFNDADPETRRCFEQNLAPSDVGSLILRFLVAADAAHAQACLRRGGGRRSAYAPLIALVANVAAIYERCLGQEFHAHRKDHTRSSGGDKLLSRRVAALVVEEAIGQVMKPELLSLILTAAKKEHLRRREIPLAA